MKKNQLFLVVVVAFLVGIASVHVTNRGTLELVFSYALYPFLRLQYMVVKPVQAFCAHRDHMKQVAHQAQVLQSERDVLMEENIRLRSSLDYMADVKELIDFSAQYDIDKERCVQVIFKHLDNAQHYILIDAGSDQGMSVDMVAVYKNMLLGKVVEVYPQYSKVLLTTDKTCKVAAYCAQTGATGIHEGCNDASTRLNRVSHLATIEQGALVFSSGTGTIFPRGFALGEVSTCALNGMVYEVQVKPLVDIQQVDYCYIVKKGQVSPGAAAEVDQIESELPAAKNAAPASTVVAHKVREYNAHPETRSRDVKVTQQPRVTQAAKVPATVTHACAPQPTTVAVRETPSPEMPAVPVEHAPVASVTAEIQAPQEIAAAEEAPTRKKKSRRRYWRSLDQENQQTQLAQNSVVDVEPMPEMPQPQPAVVASTEIEMVPDQESIQVSAADSIEVV